VNQLGALGLVVNLVVLRNTIYINAAHREFLRRTIGRKRVSLAVRRRCKNPTAITTTFAIRFATRIAGLWTGLRIVAERSMPLKRPMKSVFAPSAKRQNDLGATSRNKFAAKASPNIGTEWFN